MLEHFAVWGTNQVLLEKIWKLFWVNIQFIKPQQMLWYNNDANPVIYSISNGVSVCVYVSSL
jgi:hypothetical protein